MRLFGWLRRKPVADDYVGRHRPGSWGEIALPPVDPPTPSEQPASVTTAPAPAVAAPAADAPSAEPVAKQRVRLGFADGTSVDLDDASGDSEVFRRAAARLINDPR